MAKDIGSIIHLIFFRISIDKNLTILKNIDEDKTDHFSAKEQTQIYTSIYSQILLLSSSFMFEYEKQFIVSRDDIDYLIRIFNPAIERIRKWDGLHDFRNNVLAHNMRISKESYLSVFEKGNIAKYNIPKNLPELTILCNCINLIGDILYETFEEEYKKQSQEIVEKSLNSSVTLLTEEDAKTDFEKVMGEVNRIRLIENSNRKASN